MSEWKFGNKEKPLGRALIYCSITSMKYIAACVDSAKKQYELKGFSKHELEEIIQGAIMDEVDVVDAGESPKEYKKFIEEQVTNYALLYEKQPKNLKEASLRLPAINQ